MIHLNIDLSALISLKEELEPGIKKALNDAARDLSLQAHAHIVEKVQEKLHSTRERYLAALSYEQVDDSTWIINLDKSALWIEEGQPEHNMLDNLLKSKKARTAKDGSKFVAVPFQHNKGPTQQTKAAQDLTATIKRELQQRKIAYNKIETDAAGRPKLGLLHKFDIKNMPLKTVEGPGQGHGPIGAVRQGNTGIPFLAGIRIYQKQIKDGMGRSKVSRSIMTFRVASSKHYGSGKWEHPGTDARRLFDEAADWALRLWETQIAPRVLDAAVKNL